MDIGLHYVACGPAYNAVAGFSTTQQGANNWWYYYSQTAQGLPYATLPNYGLYAAWYGATDYWCLVASNWQHPGEANNDSVRRFVMPQAGRVRVRSRVANDNGYPPSDGVLVCALLNNQPVTGWQLVLPGPVYRPLDFDLQVQAGDTLDFQVNKNGNNGYDSTFWSPLITYLGLADADGDGLPDYLEDRNGNGVFDSGSGAGETNWQAYDSPNQLTGPPGLQVFTPLK